MVSADSMAGVPQNIVSWRVPTLLSKTLMSAPLDLIRSLLDEQIHVKLRDNRELAGTLHAYDEHCNLVLGNTEETVYSWTDAQTVEASKSNNEMLFVRGDQVIYIRNKDQ